MVKERLLKWGIVTVSVLLILIMTPLIPAGAISSQWTYSTPSLTQDDMMKITNIRHNGNLLIKEITLPHVLVQYPTGLIIDDEPGQVYADPPYIETLFDYKPEETIFQVYFYFECSKQDWNDNGPSTYGCYKYKQFYTLDDGDATWPDPRFRITIQAFGPGFGPNNYGSCCPSRGYPTYNPEWRVDTDMPDTAPLPSLDYARWKQADGSWITLNNQGGYYEDRYIDNTNSGQQWRTVDKNTGWVPSFGITPTKPAGFQVDADVTIVPYHSYETDVTYGNFAYDLFIDSPNPESIFNQDIVIWYRGIVTADSTHCVIGYPCKIESNWLPTGGW